ncbi:lysine N(6)-hydroxylase/L-ornithine N(5)-oxygenase family protein [Atopomonas sediminilitoris]|uniref:lysine N(6)-hydroxylase/L-ornithine N(5)-oxygenase family protein n=1 Tax=Atopomonas sediminilitoris TaxID=2919919 RepID=UPI001F4E23D0|nr:lysine N(6)-hydroxylase/L-ornithine N(5)-oxygenase family protein [Atopomonas sediminilitoris]MCJ8167727.1 lysine N(6)-hydroxylase/L-ornithine N(5)-oxygenase family protein [Atopomonas sediminilitoris]
MAQVRDLIGIGIGPFNLSLAALLDQHAELDACFFEQKAAFNWHQGLLLPGTTLQVPFMADLVSMVCPTSRYSFLNYLQAQDRLFHFYFHENFFTPRREYNHYCQWVAEQLASLHFAHHVVDVRIEQDLYRVEVQSPSGTRVEYARHVVLGTGSVPNLPACLRELALAQPKQVLHSADFATRFLPAFEAGQRPQRVMVLGSGQSAAEVFQHLLSEQEDRHGQRHYALHWLTRAQGFLPMEYSKLGLEHFTPDYTEYFQRLPQSTKDQLLPNQGLFYKGISFTTISEIFDLLYHRTVAGAELPAELMGHCTLTAAERAHNGSLRLTFRHSQQNVTFTREVDTLIAATGYAHRLPSCLRGLQQAIAWDGQERLQIDSDYRVKHQGPGCLFVQNGELHTHGMGAPDLGLGAIRAGHIANQLLGREAFKLPKRSAFQRFGVAA